MTGGMEMCRYCRSGVCSRCDAHGPVHRDSFWVGGHGWQAETFCHDRQGCARRAALRHGLCLGCGGCLPRPVPAGNVCQYCRTVAEVRP